MENVLLTRRYFITGSQRLSNFFWASLISFGGASFLVTGFLSFLSRFTSRLQKEKLELDLSFINFQSVQQSSSPKVLPLIPLDEGANLSSFFERAQLATRLDLGGSLQKPEGASLDSFFGQNGFTEGADAIFATGTGSDSISFFPQGLIMCFYGSLGLIFGLYLWLSIFWKVGNGFNEFNKSTGVVRIFRWGLPGKNRQINLQYKIKEIEALKISLKEGVNPRRSIALQIKGKGEIPLTRIGQPMALQDIENQASELASFLKVEIQVVQN